MILRRRFYFCLYLLCFCRSLPVFAGLCRALPDLGSAGAETRGTVVCQDSHSQKPASRPASPSPGQPASWPARQLASRPAGWHWAFQKCDALITSRERPLGSVILWSFFKKCVSLPCILDGSVSTQSSLPTFLTGPFRLNHVYHHLAGACRAARSPGGRRRRRTRNKGPRALSFACENKGHVRAPGLTRTYTHTHTRTHTHTHTWSGEGATQPAGGGVMPYLGGVRGTSR